MRNQALKVRPRFVPGLLGVRDGRGLGQSMGWVGSKIFYDSMGWVGSTCRKYKNPLLILVITRYLTNIVKLS